MRLNFEVGKWDDVIFKLQKWKGGGGGVEGGYRRLCKSMYFVTEKLAG